MLRCALTTILTVGPDDLAQTTRDLILEGTGFVTTNVNSQDVLRTLQHSQYDVVVIAHKARTETDNEIAAKADEHTRIIRLGEFTRPRDLLDLMHRKLEA